MNPEPIMQFSQSALDVLKSLEGLRLEVYEDAAGVPTIGYGHVIRPGDKMEVTELEAALLLKTDLKRFCDHVEEVCEDGGRSPDQSQFDAMVCLAFNIGEAEFTGSSILRRFLNNDDSGAAAAFLLWNKIRKYNPASGRRELRPSRTLDARRTAESRMFLLGYYDPTPYNPLDDDGRMAELHLARNHTPGDEHVAAGSSEIRPTLKTSRTVKQSTVGGVSAAATAGTAGVAGLSAVAEGMNQTAKAAEASSDLADKAKEAAESAASVREAVENVSDAATTAADAAGTIGSMLGALSPLLYIIAAAGGAISLVSFILVRRARKDDWNRGYR